MWTPTLAVRATITLPHCSFSGARPHHGVAYHPAVNAIEALPVAKSPEPTDNDGRRLLKGGMLDGYTSPGLAKLN
jgi:hypothetical protein